MARTVQKSMARSMTTLIKLKTNALTKSVQQRYTSRAATCGTPDGWFSAYRPVT
jgi:hypothetical protein